MTPLDLYLQRIQEDPMFPALLEKLKKAQPSVPIFNSEEDNTERWKLHSGRRQGFDTCLSLMKIKLGD